MGIFRAAVIGCGHISARHLDALEKNEKCELVAVCDINRERADAKAGKYSVKAFYNIDDLLRWGGFDVLHICTPHYLHAPMAVSAMNNGKHVLCEKPLAIHYSDAVKMCECAQKNNVYLGVCFQNRYNPASQYMKNLLDSGGLGAVTAVKGMVTWSRDESYYNADDWHGTLEKEGGGVVINQSIHTIDLMQWLSGSDIESVSGSVSQKKLAGKIETEDTADARIRFENGVEAVFYATLGYSVNSPVFLEVICEKGRIVLYDDLTVYRDGATGSKMTFDKTVGDNSYWGSGHKMLIDDFYDSILNGKKFTLSGEEGAKAVKIVDALYSDARSKN